MHRCCPQGRQGARSFARLDACCCQSSRDATPTRAHPRRKMEKPGTKVGGGGWPGIVDPRRAAPCQRWARLTSINPAKKRETRRVRARASGKAQCSANAGRRERRAGGRPDWVFVCLCVCLRVSRGRGKASRTNARVVRPACVKKIQLSSWLSGHRRCHCCRSAHHHHSTPPSKPCLPLSSLPLVAWRPR